MVGIKLKRKISESEQQFANRVFGNTLPFDKIRISNTIGLGNRQYTTPELKYEGGWTLHLGREMYANAIGNGWNIFIHELVHVWQSYHSPIKWAYAANSMCQQIVLLKFGRAYNYELGKNWGNYHAEQQAQLVEDWCVDGKFSENDDRFPYIRDNIRLGLN